MREGRENKRRGRYLSSTLAAVHDASEKPPRATRTRYAEFFLLVPVKTSNKTEKNTPRHGRMWGTVS